MSFMEKADEGKILNISLARIKPNPYQPRKHFDTVEVEELANSIRQYGILQPIIVRRTRTGEYELIAGERRFRASAMLRLDTIPAIVRDISDDDSAVVALIENLQRSDLSFFEEAESYRYLIRERGFTQEQISIKVGKRQSTVANKMRLLNLPDEVRRAIVRSTLTERHARALLKLPGEEYQLRAINKITEENLNVAATEKYVDGVLETILAKAEREEMKKASVTAVRTKDYRIFLNTIKKALDMVKKEGITAKTRQIENDGYYEYIIRIDKPTV